MKSTMMNKTAALFFSGTMAVLAAQISTSNAAPPDAGTACDVTHPISQMDSEGAGQNLLTNQALTLTFIGPIANPGKLKKGGKQAIRVCEGAQLEYRAVSTVGSPSCTLDKKAVPATGIIMVESGLQRLVCTNKPDGSDVDQFQIIGVNR